MIRAKVLAALGGVALLAACASPQDIEALRSEIASVRALAEGADRKASEALAAAQQAQEDAAAARAEAQAASEKADRIFRAGLRK